MRYNFAGKLAQISSTTINNKILLRWRLKPILAQPNFDRRTATHLMKTVLNLRTEPRTQINILVYLQRSINSVQYRHGTETIDISANGAQLLLSFPIEVGAELTLFADGERFTDQAVVRHCHQ
jgi:hypothetical protein